MRVRAGRDARPPGDYGFEEADIGFCSAVGSGVLLMDQAAIASESVKTTALP
jgi:hypothetical protein